LEKAYPIMPVKYRPRDTSRKGTQPILARYFF